MKSPANDEPLTSNSNTKRSKAREELDLAQHSELGFTTRLSPRQVSACKSSIHPSDCIQIGHTTRLSPRQEKELVAPTSRCAGPRHEADNRLLLSALVLVPRALEEEKAAFSPSPTLYPDTAE